MTNFWVKEPIEGLEERIGGKKLFKKSLSSSKRRLQPHPGLLRKGEMLLWGEREGKLF